MGNDKIPNTKNVKNKFGPMGIKKEDQVWTRGVMFASLTIIVAVMKWRKMGGEINWAAQNEIITEPRSHFLPCSPKYLDETKKFEGCALKQCGRFVVDDLFRRRNSSLRRRQG